MQINFRAKGLFFLLPRNVYGIKAMRAEMSNLNERLPSMEASAELLRPLITMPQPDDPSALSEPPQ